jgi:cytochrome bd ubiquinol oxidase subunit II
VLLGACWLVMKTEGELQAHAVRWAKLAWAPVVLGMGLMSLATPVVSATVRERWFSMPEFIALLPIPLITLAALVAARAACSTRSRCWAACAGCPSWLVVAVFVLGAIGLAYSLFPYVVMDRLTIWEAASATELAGRHRHRLRHHGAHIVGYTIFSYRVFGGKVKELSYA